ncbi:MULTISPECIES: hypothetical protein [Bacillales]|uniref:hypothetical protein n=1 Tax=Bacillales TaxID=1385 RepID=UPI00140CDA05|nr:MULTISPECIES: hypothetical protein [Bacillaceae]MCA0991258.1 hypothetical protein [Pseudalkalibacillus hwajinpoensis]WLR61633.1 hypothetical protein LC071_10255 [Pseudalkalibacillus hwajinpoensis]
MNNKKFMLKIATSLVAVMLITACNSGENDSENGNNSMNNGSNTEEPAANENSENSAE